MGNKSTKISPPKTFTIQQFDSSEEEEIRLKLTLATPRGKSKKREYTVYTKEDVKLTSEYVNIVYSPRLKTKRKNPQVPKLLLSQQPNSIKNESLSSRTATTKQQKSPRIKYKSLFGPSQTVINHFTLSPRKQTKESIKNDLILKNSLCSDNDLIAWNKEYNLVFDSSFDEVSSRSFNAKVVGRSNILVTMTTKDGFFLGFSQEGLIPPSSKYGNVKTKTNVLRVYGFGHTLLDFVQKNNHKDDVGLIVYPSTVGGFIFSCDSAFWLSDGKIYIHQCLKTAYNVSPECRNPLLSIHFKKFLILDKLYVWEKVV
ncbi:hypothetical protein EIN_207040 [Entamoeba invadens IP1]|uniref:TLDc domain-containing protein n=1 Tax=Entamoeba invadens IP1 TaxID=370355 RepID=A0A0A1U9H5_ENTIV|nr:hypothetical protein EIN_207040 [Entamoeba invadens IP1]ELP91667.1 hypothetical protein EIN_207040 [Entamoeba invadens IP1]|eukprot:XP_004258438.1 hypothetical protein EIN_207040 [Entamoeba invadens IP1]